MSTFRETDIACARERAARAGVTEHLQLLNHLESVCI